MVDMTVSGWYPSNVQVLRSWRPWGPQGLRHALVELQMLATNFAAGAACYPTDGIPAPGPTLVGMRESIEYIIPISPFTRVSGSGQPSLPARSIPWGCQPPTYGVSGGTVSNPVRIRVFGNRFSTAVSAGAGAEATYTQQVEYATLYTASTIFTTDAMKAYGIFVGK